jgi:Carboxypeptidase regulatory-like domain/Putative zinc-finger
MSEHQHPGLHPDADSLNAFIEGVLPEHERLECMAHLADCARCREIVYLAQEPVAPAPIPASAEPVSFWKRWFTKVWFAPIPVLAAAVVCVLLVSIGVYRLIRSERVEPALTAVATAPIEPPASLSEPLKEPPAPRAAKSIATRGPAIIQDAAPAAAPVATAPRVVPVSPAVLLPPPPTTIAGAQFAQPQNPVPQIATSGIAGTVTDPAGGAVPGAVVTVRPVTGAPNIDTRTDNNGQFNFAGLPPGQYELQFISPGFKQARKQIDLQPQLVARADSRLEVGAANETVTVSSEASLLKTESGELSHTVVTTGVSALPLLPPNARTGLLAELPGRLPPSTTASKDKLMLKTDPAGTLFFSKNGGKSWKAVKPLWRGKVVRVESARDSGAVFQLTTDSGSVWLSRDGAHWNPASALR